MGISDTHEKKGSEALQRKTPSKQLHHTKSVNINKSNSSLFLWILLDGIGLSIVAACTILGAVFLWRSFFRRYWSSNIGSILIYFSGITSQVVGIMFLLGFAASLLVHHWMETTGMAFLTVGPIMNMLAAHLFESKNENDDDTGLFTAEWLTSESVELFGIILLDISCYEFDPEIIALSFEVIGFFFLCCAAMIQFDYSHVESAAVFFVPTIELKSGIVHYGECFGLLLLTAVAFGQYHLKMLKKEKEKHVVVAQHHLHHHHHFHHVHHTVGAVGPNLFKNGGDAAMPKPSPYQLTHYSGPPVKENEDAITGLTGSIV